MSLSPPDSTAETPADETRRVWRFGDFVLDTLRYELRCGTTVIKVEPQVFDVLTELVRHHDRFVSKEELFDSVWGGRFVGEAALTSRIKAARRALGDDGESQRFIRTVRGRGYQFVGEIMGDRTADAPRPPEAPVRQHIAFCRAADGARLAYAMAGDGPPLVRAANWMTHLGYDIESPVWRHWVRDLSQRHCFVRYDERGCGLSDWETTDFSFDAWVTDLETVVEAVGLDRFPLLGVSQGGAVAVAYAARHPDRVSRLVLCGAYARGRAVRAADDVERQAAALDLDLARVGWGRDDPAFRQVFAAQFLPDGTRADWAAFDQLQRRTTSPDNAVRFLTEFGRIDVRDEAQQVTCPTLVLHSRDDHRVPMRYGEELAACIPRAELVALDSNNHLLTAAEPAWPVFCGEVEAFLAATD
ncbi:MULTISPECIES: alpha/beta fold hydrolase [Mycobacteriaceae]|uniref:alpha/beta fold hydrolase n=1 Tax=Mycobacteriaceae TaxID=1762 RepID=UPI0008018B1C|nr:MULTISPECIES: alpha/beta fold hydrolase [Mycobacteriaceae]MCK0174323.1 alpha/beta fold hydrolase [Mycolicibacterium sp. F2034L]OBB60338.1 transcriptional regulator [Mycobacterium sp. 852013-51886_SCH5428379]